MNLFDRLTNFIKSLDEKRFLQYTYLISLLVLLSVIFFIYIHRSRINSLKKELQRINFQRQETQSILNKEIIVRQQKTIVDDILENSKTFKPIEYFESVTNKLGLEKNLKERSTSENTLENLRTKGYKEFIINAIFTDLNMKQLVDLLDEFEKNERIYIKNLEITKSNKSATIDVNIIIATLLPEEETITEE